MQYKQINREENITKELTLFFAGWGMDEHPFSNISNSNNDVIILYDYRFNSGDFATLERLVAPYKSINVVAWSMGVWGATKILATAPEILKKVKSSTAINGTLIPTDSTKGIPLDIYNKTIDNLPKGLPSINLRMSGGRAMLDNYNKIASQRDVNEIIEELIAIRDESQKLESIKELQDSIIWDRVIIADRDLIIPTANQECFWIEYKQKINKNLEIKRTEGPHYLFNRWDSWEF